MCRPSTRPLFAAPHFIFLSELYEAGINIPILHMGKIRFREVVQSPPTRKWPSQCGKLGLFGPVAPILPSERRGGEGEAGVSKTRSSLWTDRRPGLCWGAQRRIDNALCLGRTFQVCGRHRYKQKQQLVFQAGQRSVGRGCGGWQGVSQLRRGLGGEVGLQAGDLHGEGPGSRNCRGRGPW